MAQGKRTTRGASRAPQKQGVPASVLLGVGFIAGVICSVLVFQMGNDSSPAVATVAKPAPATKKKAEEKPVTTSTKFDFFTLLPEREVIVPDEASAAKAVASKPAPDNKPQPQKPALPDGEKYILQAGSFRQSADADRRRAQILLLGLDAKVEAVEANGDRWHRVYVGPFTSHNTLSDARAKLIDESIDTLVVRQKKP
jgi:cell division protein FtsN